MIPMASNAFTEGLSFTKTNGESMQHRTTACFLILLLLCCGLQCNTDVARVVLPEVTETSETTPLFEMEAILATRGEVHSPIPDDVYELLWGHWTKAGLSAPRHYYTKYIDAEGIAIVGGDTVHDGLFQRARHIVLVMTSKMPALREALSITTPGVQIPIPFRIILRQMAFENPDNPHAPDPTWDYIRAIPEIGDSSVPSGTGQFYAYPHAIVGAGTRPDGSLSMGALEHEFAHAIHGAFIDYPHLFPGFNFAERLGNAYERQMEHFRLREEAGIPLNNNLGPPYPVCHPKDSYAYVDAWEFWAVVVHKNWFGHWNSPEGLASQALHDSARQGCTGLYELMEEVFPRFSLRYTMWHTDYSQF